MKTFGFFRITFGLYLLWHFASLIPFGAELFSSEGVLSPETNPYFGKWPNPLFLESSTFWITPLLFIACLASSLFTIGHLRRTSSLVLWFILTCTFTANPLISTPSIPYIGLLLLFCALIPNGEFYRLGKATDPHWKMPALILPTAWILLATGYTFSGFLKLSSPSWIDGSALQHLLNNPLARPGIFRDLALSLPDFILQVGTWLTLALELLFLPLILFKKTRPWTWLALFLMHLGIITLVDFADLSLGMVFIHLFTTPLVFRTMFKAIPASGEKPHLLFIDGECVFCQNTAKLFTRFDKKAVLNFAPLQGQTANTLLPPEWRQTLNDDGTPTGAIALIENPGASNERSYQAFDALFRTLHLMGGITAILAPLIHLPTVIKSPLYHFIARNRHHLRFLLPKNSRDTCPIPDASTQARFLP